METFREIQANIWKTEHGKNRMELMKRGWELADEQKDYQHQMQFRMDYMEEATFFEDAMLLYVVFPKLLKLHDEHVAEYGNDPFTYNVMWRYKWVLENARDFYQISLEQFRAFCEDFKSRCQSLNYSLRTYYEYQFIVYIYGDKEAAADAYQRFMQEKRDALSDCPACERDTQIIYLLALGDFEEAEIQAQALFSGKLKCKEVPEVTYGAFLRAYNWKICSGKIVDLEKVQLYCDKIRQAVSRQKIGTEFIGDILLFYALTDTPKALPFYKKYWPYFEENKNPAQRFYFACAAARFFADMKEKGSYRMKLPANFPCYHENDVYNVAELREYYEAAARSCMGKLDERNHSHHFADLFQLVMK